MAEIQAALAQSQVKNISAQMKTRTLMNGRLAMVMTGRINLNGPLTGRIRLRTTSLGGNKAQTIDEIITRRAAYVRVKPSKAWQQVPDTEQAKNSVPNLARYAELLLEAGPSAVKEQERRNGGAATRLSGKIKTERLRKIEPGLYDRLRAAGVDDFQCDVWVDRKGRVVRLEQWFTLQGIDAHNIMTLTKFRAALTVRAPSV